MTQALDKVNQRGYWSARDSNTPGSPLNKFAP